MRSRRALPGSLRNASASHDDDDSAPASTRSEPGYLRVSATAGETGADRKYSGI
jgi:hypothetical protein